MTSAELRQWVIDATEDEPVVRAQLLGMIELCDRAERFVLAMRRHNLELAALDADMYAFAYAASSGKSPGGVG